jgi:FkbH-like protein
MAAQSFTPLDLPWLPAPPADLKARLAALEASEGDWGKPVRSLATHALNLNQAILVSRTASKLATARPAVSLSTFKLGIVSNGTIDFLKPMLEVAALRHGVLLELCAADFGQGMQEALNPDSKLNRFRPDAVLLALDHRGLPFRSIDANRWPPFDARAAFAELAAMRDGFRRHGRTICLVQTLPAPADLVFGSLETAIAGSLRAEIARFNALLAEDALAKGDLLVDVDWLAQSVGLAQWYDDRQWFLARLPFLQRALPLYADFVARIPAAMRGKAKKCLVLDLDNTLWGGVIGDDGLEGIALNEGDARGEAHRAVQAAADQLRRRGVVLAVCSKNDDATARLPFRSHPGMILKEDDIAVFVANWNDKASNLERIAQQLDLGLDSFVLLDDNPAERELIRQALPQVTVPELGPDAATYARTLLAAGYFESIAFTAEDLARAEQYRDNAERAQLLETSRDLNDFLRSLQMEIEFAPFDARGRKRTTQLINKTNQFNVTTRRYTEAQVAEMETSPRHCTLQVSVRDRFGDNGMIGVVICEVVDDAWRIDSWLMSCRVLNRRIEEAICNRLVEAAQAAGARRLIGEYIPTNRNGIVAELFSGLGFEQTGESGGSHFWTLDLERFEPFDVPVRVVESRATESAVA